jgi:hypothetical protein
LSNEPLDPEVGLKHAPNTALLAVLRAQAVPSVDPRYPAWNVGRYELHTHPDLGERLNQLASSLPRHQERILYGSPVLATQAGFIFAVAWGMKFLAFRLAEADLPLAAELGGDSARERAQKWISPLAASLEANWIAFDPWGSDLPSRKWTGDLEYFCALACQFTASLDRE